MMLQLYNQETSTERLETESRKTLQILDLFPTYNSFFLTNKLASFITDPITYSLWVTLSLTKSHLKDVIKYVMAFISVQQSGLKIEIDTFESFFIFSIFAFRINYVFYYVYILGKKIREREIRMNRQKGFQLIVKKIRSTQCPGN